MLRVLGRYKATVLENVDLIGPGEVAVDTGKLQDTEELKAVESAEQEEPEPSPGFSIADLAWYLMIAQSDALYYGSFFFVPLKAFLGKCSSCSLSSKKPFEGK